MRLSLLALAGHLATALSLSIEASSLRTEGVVAPLGLHLIRPRLSWRLASDKRGDTQTAYQIQASSTASGFENADSWDSGKTPSSRPYASWQGETLSSRKRIFWRVRVWGDSDSASEWSDVTTLEMGLLSDTDWSAEWITNTNYVTRVTGSLPMFAKNFGVDCTVASARLYITGLGVVRAEINGKPVTDELMGPAYSTLNKTILYGAYDVTPLLQEGENAIGVAVGKGIYNVDRPLGGRYQKFRNNLKPHLVKSQLEYTCQSGSSHTLISDATWLTTTDGPLLESTWFGGEEYDARKEFPDWSSPQGDRSSWITANISQGPEGGTGKFYSQAAPQLKIVDELTPKSMKKAGNQWVFDFGVNFVGWFTFRLDGTGLRGTRLEFWPAENVTGAGAPNQASTGKPIFDGYTIAGKESESFTLQFMYHGFQYLAVNSSWEPKLSDLTGHVIRAANEKVGSVQISNPLLNRIHEIIDRAIQGNMYSVLTDCPHREKLGWLEQDHLAFEILARGYDIQTYGHDLVRTIADAQVQSPAGLIPTTAPEYTIFSGTWEVYRVDPNWGNAIMRVPLQLYQYYGDRALLNGHYGVMVEYMQYLAGRSNGPDDPIIDDGLGLRDWAANDKTVPIGLTNTFAYQQAASAMAQIARWTGRCEDARRWKKLDADIRAAFHRKWFSFTEGGRAHYSVDNQATNALALDMGAVPEEHVQGVFGSMMDAVERAGWTFTLGEIALPSMLRTLQAHGRDDAVFRLMTQTEKSSYGFQIENGATSLWEHWNGTNEGGIGSLNHFMMGAGDYWLHRLSGLAPHPGSVMWARIDYSPIVVGDLTSASSSYRTPFGLASASWALEGSTTLKYDVVVPVGSVGVVTLKAREVKEGGEVVKDGERGVVSAKTDGAKIVVEVGSGTYRFEATT